jgi:hypothetical protein
MLILFEKKGCLDELMIIDEKQVDFFIVLKQVKVKGIWDVRIWKREKWQLINIRIQLVLFVGNL